MTNARLTIEGLTKSFSRVQVLHDVSFEVGAGEVLGLVGENGSGKSTTMNILAGILRKDGGNVFLDGESFSPQNRRQADTAGIAFIQQELSIFPNLSVVENLFLGRFPRRFGKLPIISTSKMQSSARELLDSVSLQVSLNTLAGALSAGERQLLEIARGLSRDARVMILDEPTTSLTQRETARLFEIIGRLRASGVAIIFISHTLEDVLRLSDRIVVMRDGRVTLRTANAGLTPHDLVTAMVGRSIESLFPQRSRRAIAGRPVLEAQNLSEPGQVTDIQLSISRGEIVGLAGLMGSGRTQLARILFGLDPHQSGTVRLGTCEVASGDVQSRIKAGVAFLTEDRRAEGLMLDASVADNMALAALPMFAGKIARRIQTARLAGAITALVSRLRVKCGNVRSSAVRTLSGGNQQKVVLSRWLMREPKLFILDEPTRGVDVGAKEHIYQALVQLADEGVGLLIISSEIEELIGLCDRILVMRSGRIQTQLTRDQFDRELILHAAFGQERAA
jgi:ribose transport system ATP-binding protein